MDEIIPQKRCTKCGEEKPATIEYFNKNCKAKDGLHPNCKLCRAKDREFNANHIYQQKKRWREDNPEKEKRRVSQWIEQNREQYLNRKHEYYQENRDHILSDMRRRYYANHEAMKQRRHEYYAKNRDAIRKSVKQRMSPERRATAVQRARLWRITNPLRYKIQQKSAGANRRARKLAAIGTFAKSDVLLAYRSQKGRCWHCGKNVGAEYHADHLIPLARGGSNNANNIVVSCPRCNSSKGAKFCWEWNGRLL